MLFFVTYTYMMYIYGALHAKPANPSFERIFNQCNQFWYFGRSYPNKNGMDDFDRNISVYARDDIVLNYTLTIQINPNQVKN